MKYILIIAILLVSFTLYAQEGLTPTWNNTVQMKAGDSLDLKTECQVGFHNAWADITGEVKVNGELTNNISWCPNSTVKAIAITDATIVLQGN